jgi:hypothetical protein
LRLLHRFKEFLYLDAEYRCHALHGFDSDRRAAVLFPSG